MHAFHKNKISFKVIGKKDLSLCSHVAAGIWNPVVFKRLTKSWMADELIPSLEKFYAECEALLGEKFTTSRVIIRPFAELQEEILWIKKSKNELDEYLDPKIYDASSAPANIKITGKYGRVKRSGNLDVARFINASMNFFEDEIIEDVFDYSKLKIHEHRVTYDNISANAVIFCEGWLIKNNPYFNWVPLKPAKGEVLTVHCNTLNLQDKIVSKGSFLMGFGNGRFKSGATYEWNRLDEKPSVEARAELEERLSQITGSEYTVQKQEAGVRPSSIDRRPVIGSHPAHKNIYVFNGLGTKGVMLAPFFSNKFVNFYLQKESLSADVNVSRFYNLYEEKK
jgi:glycine oxidase